MKIMKNHEWKFAKIHENNENYEKLRKIMKFTKNNEKLWNSRKNHIIPRKIIKIHEITRKSWKYA